MRKGIWLLISLFLLSGCHSFGNQAKETRSSQVPKETTALSTSETKKAQAAAEKKKISQQAQKIVENMTLEEQVGQLFLARVPEKDRLTDLEKYHLGGYLLFGRDYEGKMLDQVRAMNAEFQAHSKTPLLIASDEEGGTVSRISAILPEPFPSPRAAYDAGGMEGVLTNVKHEAEVLKSVGIATGLFPVADVATDPAAFIYPRTLGLDAQGTADYVSQVVTVLKKEQLGSTLKHFPGYGNNADSHVAVVRDERSLQSLENNDFLPFAAGIKAGADSILVSHNIVTAIDPSMPASLSAPVHQLLREKLGFEGVIMTDDMDMAGLADFISQKEAGIKALQAGNDLILSSSYAQQIPYILEQEKAGNISKKTIAQACERVVLWKIKLGLITE